MTAISSRIAHIIEVQCRGNRSAFAREINVTPSYVALLSSGQRIPSDRTIADICRVFGVEEAWLRTGVGEMKIEKSHREELSAIFNAALDGNSSKDKFLRGIAQIPDAAFPTLIEIIRTVAKELEE